MQLHERLGCLGYYGFGGGWVIPKQYSVPQGEVWCAQCHVRDECWKKHRERVHQLVPGVAADFDALAARVGGQEAVRQYIQQHKIADPYSMIMVGNFEDGSRVGADMPVKERGQLTLPWPFIESEVIS